MKPEQVIVTIRGQRVKAQRTWLRHIPGMSAENQQLQKPRKYVVPPNVAIELGDLINDTDEEATVAVTYISRRKKKSGAVKEIILECR